MIKIKYPAGNDELNSFQRDYLDAILAEIDGLSRLRTALGEIKLPDRSTLSLEKLLLAKFEDLLIYSELIEKKTRQGYKKKLLPLTQYDKLQKFIASFFIDQQHLNMSSCYYCNIDTIYIFNEFGDYRSGLDFVQRADKDQLMLVSYIKEKTAEKIAIARPAGNYTDVSELPVSDRIKDSLNSGEYKIKKTHSHFTLDHFYPKGNYPYLSLCLYNFVPCCYVCNSKFKKDYKVYDGTAFRTSPSASSYTLADDMHFKVYFAKPRTEVKGLDDFSVALEIADNDVSTAKYLKTLRIRGRYMHYKPQALKLIRRQVDYPQSALEELSRVLGKTVDAIRSEVFGEELFDGAYDNVSLIKYKRDIAASIGIFVEPDQHIPAE